MHSLFCHSHSFNSSTFLLCHTAIINKSQTVFKSFIGGFDAHLKLACTYDFISDNSKLSKYKSNISFESSVITSVLISFITAIFSIILFLILSSICDKS
ncbi:MAG: hypothetical protein U9Q66_01805 [Patescibacteria group bacterium]|nr:hypothetical protein [Patescibacteria group bacterium]